MWKLLLHNKQGEYFYSKMDAQYKSDDGVKSHTIHLILNNGFIEVQGLSWLTQLGNWIKNSVRDQLG